MLSNGFEQSVVVEPIDRFQGGVFDGVEAAPWATPVNDLCFEQAVDRFRQGIVVGIPNAADRRGDLRLGLLISVEK